MSLPDLQESAADGVDSSPPSPPPPPPPRQRESQTPEPHSPPFAASARRRNEYHQTFINNCHAAQDQQSYHRAFDRTFPSGAQEWHNSPQFLNGPIVDRVMMVVDPSPPWTQYNQTPNNGGLQSPVRFVTRPIIDQVIMEVQPQQQDRHIDQSPRSSVASAPEPLGPFDANQPIVDQVTIRAAPQSTSRAATGKTRSHCPTCGVSYGRREDMLRHLRGHNSHHKYLCSFCSRSYKRRDVWREHQDICGKQPDALVPKRGRLARCLHCFERDIDCTLRTPCSNCLARGEACVRRFNDNMAGRSLGSGQLQMLSGQEQAIFPSNVSWSPPGDSVHGHYQSKIQNALFQNYSRRFEGPMRWWIARLSTLTQVETTNSGFGDGEGSLLDQAQSSPSFVEMAQQLDSDLMSWHQQSAWTVLKTAIAAFGSQGIDPKSDRWVPQYGCDNACRQDFLAKAKTSIEDSADVLSFQVILAKIIIGMIHSPVSECDDSFASEALSGISFPRQDSRRVGNRFIRQGISDVFQLIRQVRDSPAIGFASTILGRQYLKTFFSLGLVIDTISSAIDGRPLLIPDEDCAIILDEDSQHTPNDGTSGLWQLSRLQIRQVKQVKTTDGRTVIDFHSRLVEEGAPITLLLTRKVTQLQTLLFRRRPQAELEACILEAIDVYNHGAKRYGGGSCDALSICDSSCTINLGIRWNLACLLLADVIERIENVLPSLKLPQKPRTILWNMRMKAVCIVSGLAGLSAPGPGCNGAEDPAASSGREKVTSAFLDDPWTQVLVSAMLHALKVSETWRKDGLNSRAPQSADVLSPSEISCLECIKRLVSRQQYG